MTIHYPTKSTIHKYHVHFKNFLYHVMRLDNQSMIQVVDDEFDIVNVIKLYLQGKGFNVFGFTDPLLALEHFNSEVH